MVITCVVIIASLNVVDVALRSLFFPRRRAARRWSSLIRNGARTLDQQKKRYEILYPVIIF